MDKSLFRFVAMLCCGLFFIAGAVNAGDKNSASDKDRSGGASQASDVPSIINHDPYDAVASGGGNSSDLPSIINQDPYE